jgi:glycosyltransferase involved in cell wall biosynthesis
MRIAWTGDPGNPASTGGAGIAYQMLAGLIGRGHEIDLYLPTMDQVQRQGIAPLRPRLTTYETDTWWQWDRWYSRDPLAAFASSLVARGRQQVKIAHAVMGAHKRRPYDVIFQMSQFESFFPSRQRGEPPFVVHPCTIARCEAEWHLRERHIGIQSEGLVRFGLSESVLRTRSLAQRHHAHRADVIVGPSYRFAELLVESYGVDRSRVRVLRHPVDVKRFHPLEDRAVSGRKELLFIARMSTRKGLDLIVDLSHRLEDLADEVQITLVGDKTLWSDYSLLLRELNPRVAEHIGFLEPNALIPRLQRARAVLVPSRFEPGSITTGEALACGAPVIASSEVGPAEIIDESCGRVFRDGDRASLERAVREVISLDDRGLERMRAAARERALLHLSADTIVQRLEQLLSMAARRAQELRRHHPHSSSPGNVPPS